jgi:hypothetical protein
VEVLLELPPPHPAARSRKLAKKEETMARYFNANLSINESIAIPKPIARVIVARLDARNSVEFYLG